jgi:hypothetical protein
MKNLQLAVVCVLLALLSAFSMSISNPDPLNSELSYQRQYNEISDKGFLTEEDEAYLQKLEDTYLKSDERGEKMRKSIGYKFLLGIGMAFVSYIGLRNYNSNILPLFAVTISVVLTSLVFNSVLESIYFSLLTILGAVFAIKYNKNMKTDNSQEH